MKIDVATFGSATKDVFLRVDPEIIESDKFRTKKGMCFPLGSKVPADEIFSTTGGGGTNTAVSFSRLGLKTAYVGKVGADGAGRDVLGELEVNEVKVNWAKKALNKRTNFSVVLDVKNTDRTIIVYREASGDFSKEEVPENLNPDWVYIAPLPEDNLDLFYYLLEKSEEENWSVAANPSENQLREDKFIKEINKLDCLIVNQEEASILTGLDYDKEKEIFEKIDEIFDGIFIMTKGPEGLIASDNERIFEVTGTPDKRVADRTGAGDAFSSGFLAGWIKTSDMKKAIQLGVGNATNCLTQKGAKNGLLKEGDDFERVDVEVKEKI